ncbi:YcgN family cysteine cluster protein [bacterium]|nr:YcgN family cysteine cluster protein [bacterium]
MTLGKKPFWENKPLTELTHEEWEALCDGCGQCCLHKIEDESTREVYYTYIACRLLDLEKCRCTNYSQRMDEVAECLRITPTGFHRMQILPETCAYRRLSEGKKLLWWHPLISNDPETVHQEDISIRGKAISEENIHPDEFENCIIDH